MPGEIFRVEFQGKFGIWRIPSCNEYLGFIVASGALQDDNAIRGASDAKCTRNILNNIFRISFSAMEERQTATRIFVHEILERSHVSVVLSIFIGLVVASRPE